MNLQMPLSLKQPNHPNIHHLVSYNGIHSTTAPLNLPAGWTQGPDPDKLNQLINLVNASSTPITIKNFRRWLVDDVAFDMAGIACPNGGDHGCNRGLGVFLGIEPYGQTGLDDDGSGKFAQLPWFDQQGYSSERLNRHVLPAWRDWLIPLPLEVQRIAYVRMLVHLRDTGMHEFNCMYPTVSDMDHFKQPAHLISTAVRPTASQSLGASAVAAQVAHDEHLYGSDIAGLPSAG